MSRTHSEWLGSSPPHVIFADVLFRQEPDEDEDEEEDDGSGNEDDGGDDDNDEGYSE